MKQLLTLFSITMLLSFNFRDKNKSQIKLPKIKIDTLKIIKNPHLNLTKNFVLGKFDYRSDSTFSKIKPPYASKEIYLKTETIEAFLKMSNEAQIAGIELKIISGTRNFEEQKVIWERKWKKYHDLEPLQRAIKILEYSAMPGSSRHHWGTDIDLNSLNNSYFHRGKGLAVYEWLKTHANQFGFYQVYTDKDQGRTGYYLENWHWSYLPLASKYLNFYNMHVVNSDITGFSGGDQAKNVLIIKNYVNGISEKAKDYK